MKKILIFTTIILFCKILSAQNNPENHDSSLVLFVNSAGAKMNVPIVSLKNKYDNSMMNDTCKLTVVWNDAKAGWGIKAFYENDSLPNAPKWVRIHEGTELPLKIEGDLGAYYINTISNTLYGPKTQNGWGIPDSLSKYLDQSNDEKETFEKGKTILLDADGTVDSLVYNCEYLITKWESYNATIYLPKAENHRGDWIVVNMVTCNDYKIWMKSASIVMLSNTTINFSVQKEFSEFNMNISGYAKFVSDGKKWIAFGIEGSEW